MNLRIAEFCRLGRHGDVFGKRERASWATAMTGNQAGPTITKIRLRDDTQPLDFRVPLPATEEAIKNSYITFSGGRRLVTRIRRLTAAIRTEPQVMKHVRPRPFGQARAGDGRRGCSSCRRRDSTVWQRPRARTRIRLKHHFKTAWRFRN
jgi:hypothetical protein